MSTVRGITAEDPVAARSLFTWSQVLRLLALTLLFTAAAVSEAVKLNALWSADIWSHLRVGTWILQNHAVPHSGLFSQYSDLPWISSSWSFEVLAAIVYKLLGLRALPILLMGMKVAVAGVTFSLALDGRSDFWTSVLLSAVAQYVIAGLQPLPVVFSILFFGIELLLLLQSRRSGNVRLLFWLPLLFLLWANLDLQFVCGLLLLGLFLAVVFAERMLRARGVTWLDEKIRPLPLSVVGWVSGLAAACTLATPYSVHLFTIVHRDLYSEVSFQYFAEMRAMSFRRPEEYVLMLLVMAAFFSLGRKRRVDLFKLSVLLAGTVVGFRIQRDIWLAVLPAIAVLGSGFQGEKARAGLHATPNGKWGELATAILVLSTFVVAASRVPTDRNTLLNKVSERFPEKACDFIRANHLPPPLFNTYSWGGFLMWYMPDDPVAVDGRVDLYGDEILDRYFKVISGKERLETDPSLARARTLLLEQQSGMAKALITLPALNSRYRMSYSDDLAAVFVRE